MDPIRGICGAHGGHEIAKVRDVRRTDGGAQAALGGRKKEWMECLLDDLRAFGINTDQWTITVQDEREWRKMAKQGAEHFMVKCIAAEKVGAGLRHAVVRPNVTGKTKERIAESNCARAGSLAIVD